jgi:formylglycine-generating enzyme required for sulfatase activity
MMGKRDERVPAKGRGLRVKIGRTLEMEFVAIPPGDFLMGAPESEARSFDELPQHAVSIGRPFYLGKYQVTRQQWKAVMGDDPSLFTGRMRIPVNDVSWKACKEFCRRLTRQLPRGGPLREIRLPSEAEWEYACRAGSQAQYGFGDSEDDLGKHAWFEDNSDGGPHVVGSKRPNAWGLYDMHGNLYEWCEDVRHKDYKRAPCDGSAWTAVGSQKARVLRGGAFCGGADNCRAAARLSCMPAATAITFGLRIVGVPRKTKGTKRSSKAKKTPRAKLATRPTASKKPPKPTTIRDDVLGEVRFAERISPVLDRYSATVRIARRKVELDLYSDDKRDILPAIELAKHIVENSKKILADARKFFCKKVLPLYKSVWWQLDMPKASPSLFEKMSLSVICITAGERVTFDYDTGDLFGGHGLWLRANQKLRFVDFDLPG